MKRQIRRWPTMLALALLTAAATVAVAIADTVTVNDLVTGGDSTKTVGQTGTAKLVMTNTNGDGGANGCNTAGDNPVSFNVSSSQPSKVSLASSTVTVTFTGCGEANAQTVAYTAVAAGSSVISASYLSGGKTGTQTASAYDTTDTLTVTVSAPPPSDTTGPNISFALDPTSPNGSDGWYTTAVGVDWTVSDGESAITSSSGCGDATVSDDGVYSLTCTATSSGGTSSETAAFKIDKTAPTVGCGSADSDWHAANVSIACTGSDDGSGLANAGDESFNLSTDVNDGAEDINASTGSRTVYDKAGNSSTAGPISGNMIDRKDPSVSCGSPDGLWHADDVSIACTASDSGAGLKNAADASFNLSTSVPGGTEDANASTDSRTVLDAVDNSSAGGPVTGNMIDKKGPSITCGTPAPSFSVGQSPANVTGSASDAGSGPASAALSEPADTSSVVGNPKSVTLSAKDNVENSTTKSCSYSVVYGAFTGFFQPVDMNGVFNRVKAGSAIPVKFSLDGAPQPGSNTPGLAGAASALMQGTPTAPNPVAALTACPTASGLFDLVEEVAADSTSGLKYDPAADQWVYVWKTTTVLANSCRQLKVTLADGTTKTANFQFTK